jgi:hypothetical protein
VQRYSTVCFAQEFEEQVRAIKQQRARHALWLQVPTHTVAHALRLRARVCARMLVHPSLCVSTVLRAYVCSSMRGPGGLCRSLCGGEG